MIPTSGRFRDSIRKFVSDRKSDMHLSKDNKTTKYPFNLLVKYFNFQILQINKPKAAELLLACFSCGESLQSYTFKN